MFNRLASRCGHVVRGDVAQLARLPDDIIPMVGCTIALRETIQGWLKSGRPFLYWDRGYWMRQGFTSLPRPKSGTGYYRLHLNGFQMQRIRDVPDDRFNRIKVALTPWRKAGNHIVVAAPSDAYAEFHGLQSWTEKTVVRLQRLTRRRIIVRRKKNNSLVYDLHKAHALVTHGSIAAIEAAIFGVPVFVDPSSAAALIGKTDLKEIENPITPDRTMWLRSLAYSQFTEQELYDGTAFKLVD